MDARTASDATGKNTTTTERKSEREVVTTRTINGPARLVFDAWSKPELFQRWWVPKSMGMTLLVCEMDVRTGGRYRLVFKVGDATPEFFGKYLEVTPCSRIVWTNEENGEANVSISTVTLEERGGKTLVVLTELHPSKEACDAALGSYEGMPETFGQLEELVAKLGASAA
jgi:uncharacterized protein YndB with AHSA1/START domain